MQQKKKVKQCVNGKTVKGEMLFGPFNNQGQTKQEFGN